MSFKFRLLPEVWGRGLATELAMRLRYHALAELKLGCLIAFAHPQNQGSLQVLKKIGLRHWRFSQFRGDPGEVYVGSPNDPAWQEYAAR